MSEYSSYISLVAIATGLLSAVSWLHASRVKISYEEASAARIKAALKRGAPPDYGGVILDGWDMTATFAAQSKWNALGAVLAATSISLQAIAQYIAL